MLWVAIAMSPNPINILIRNVYPLVKCLILGKLARPVKKKNCRLEILWMEAQVFLPTGSCWLSHLHQCQQVSCSFISWEPPLQLQNILRWSAALGMSPYRSLCVFPSEPKVESPWSCLLSQFLKCVLLPEPSNSVGLQESFDGISSKASAASLYQVDSCFPPCFHTCCRQLAVLLLLPLEGCLFCLLPTWQWAQP